MKFIVPILLLLLCGNANAQNASLLRSEDFAKSATDFGAYWYRGLAELNRYELSQLRYGELHPGESVLIFVTEDFLKTKQVKHEFGPKDDATSTLKSHHHRRFWTGVYPYNIHTTAFVPVDRRLPSLKIAFTSTEWCGVVYTQFNHRGAHIDVTNHSYFQAEGDQRFELPAREMEDALWSRARINPATLPTGSFELVPSIHYLRLLHKPIQVEKVTGSWKRAQTASFLKTPTDVYELNYPGLQRSLRLFIEPSFPYRIQAFEESYIPLGQRTVMTTRGILKTSVMLDYWARHNLSDGVLRQKIGLMPL